MTEFYVYELRRPNGTVFYVGMGCGHRVDNHEYLAARGKVGPRYDVIRQVWQSGHQIGKRIVYRNLERNAVRQEERRRILMYGLDNLTNEVVPALGTDDPISLAEAGAQVSRFVVCDLVQQKRRLEAVTGRAYRWTEICARANVRYCRLEALVANTFKWLYLEDAERIIRFFRSEGLTDFTMDDLFVINAA